MQQGGGQHDYREHGHRGQPAADAMPVVPRQDPAKEIGSAQIARAHERRRQRRGDLPGKQTGRALRHHVENDERRHEKGDDGRGHPARQGQNTVIRLRFAGGEVGLVIHTDFPAWASGEYGSVVGLPAGLLYRIMAGNKGGRVWGGIFHQSAACRNAGCLTGSAARPVPGRRIKIRRYTANRLTDCRRQVVGSRPRSSVPRAAFVCPCVGWRLPRPVHPRV